MYRLVKPVSEMSVEEKEDEIARRLASMPDPEKEHNQWMIEFVIKEILNNPRFANLVR